MIARVREVHRRCEKCRVQEMRVSRTGKHAWAHSEKFPFGSAAVKKQEIKMDWEEGVVTLMEKNSRKSSETQKMGGKCQ